LPRLAFATRRTRAATSIVTELRSGAGDPGALANLADDPLQRIIGLDLSLVIARKAKDIQDWGVMHFRNIQ
jgi:hypothetical protein